MLEGTEGSGKTTIAERLVGAYRALGRDAIVTREPGGTAIGEMIREVLFAPASLTMRAETEALLFAAARAQHVAEVIRPALDRGGVVISDRFTDSSLAYQWGGRGLPRDLVDAAQRFATDGLDPDLKLLLDVPVEIGLRRRLRKQADANRLDHESREFHARVRDAYHSLVEANPKRWRIIDASRPRDDVWQDVWSAIVGADPFMAHESLHQQT
ncbi:MAG: dTMP kinase [Thermomicrobiales bacterium]